MTDVREAAQNLIEYAIHRSMIGQDDRIWAYNTILECIGATGPALDMAWALQVEKLSLLHPDTLPNFDLEGTLAALAEAAVTNGAAEDYVLITRTSSGWYYNDCIGDPAGRYPQFYSGKIGYIIEIDP